MFFVIFKIEVFKPRFSAKNILLLLTSYLILKSALNGNLLFDFKILKGLLLVFWISILLHKIEDLKTLKFVILIGINSCILVSLILIGAFFFKTGILPFSNTAEVNKLLLLERPYIGFIAVLGFLLALEKAVEIVKWRKIYIFNSVVLLGFILLISARISIITIFFIAGIYFLFYLKTKWYKKILGALMLFLLFAVIVVSNKNIAERFFIKSNLEQSLQQASDYEPRIVIWNCAYKMTKLDDFNFFTGFDGYQTIKNNLLDCYSYSIENASKKEYFLTEKFNTHNQFIDFYLVGGIIAFLLFTLFFIKLFLEVKLDFFKIAITVSFLLFFIVENIFYRQFGCYLFGIFVLILPQTKINEEN
ncbi:O-antigen ligase family protein [Flavobacterium sp. 17A]|uniref:O-antigen ligase family protein n=1 Tax=Flavobacterium potami TaxID=2872310 RepID=A0A9X1HBM2_9FLAO|nr:O-antigen ligase family protein [Flavobacterium potami]MBZ4035791.1 O-antigen ligase family protein [Flavobacterium potami]